MRHIDTYFLDDELSARVFDVFEPEKITHKTVVFFIHGGGWTGGSRTTFWPVMAELNRRGYLCASTDYRLISPGLGKRLTALDQLRDVRESYSEFMKIAASKIPGAQSVVFGSSAGAHLASLVLTALPGECGEEAVPGKWQIPAGGILQSTPVTFEPWEDIFPAVWKSMQLAAGALYEDDPARFRALSMVSYVRPQNPPLLFLEAGNEHMFPGKMTEKLVKDHQKMGINSRWVTIEAAEHGFLYALVHNPQKKAFAEFVKFLEDIEK